MSQRVFRSTTNNMFFGVCSGLARFFDIDPVIVRVAFVLAAFADGFGLVAYILLLILMPRQPWHMTMQNPSDAAANAVSTKQHTPAFWFGIALVVVGVFAFVNEFLPWFGFDTLWPVILVALGGSLIYRSLRRTEQVPL
ncbi:hypothetical protein BH10BAC6_BH10BAC6_15970 [soil metagenome]